MYIFASIRLVLSIALVFQCSVISKVAYANTFQRESNGLCYEFSSAHTVISQVAEASCEEWDQKVAPLLSRMELAFQLLEAARDENYIGEKVSQLGHALQAADLAKKSGGDWELIIAALFHDIGHLCPSSESEPKSEFGVTFHHRVGARFLIDLGFSEKIATLVKGHVDAKRYKVAADPNYYSLLTPPSQATLVLQGGPMDETEMTAFRTNQYFEEILKMREFDEQAKDQNWNGPQLDEYRTLIKNELVKLHLTDSNCI